MTIRAITTKEELTRTVYGFRASRIILTAFELGLFTALGQASLNAAQLAAATAHGDSYTAAEIGGWMRAAGLKGLVKKDTPFAAALLIGRKP